MAQVIMAVALFCANYKHDAFNTFRVETCQKKILKCVYDTTTYTQTGALYDCTKQYLEKN